jgi:hypothetical protein
LQYLPVFVQDANINVRSANVNANDRHISVPSKLVILVLSLELLIPPWLRFRNSFLAANVSFNRSYSAYLSKKISKPPGASTYKGVSQGANVDFKI